MARTGSRGKRAQRHREPAVARPDAQRSREHPRLPSRQSGAPWSESRARGCGPVQRAQPRYGAGVQPDLCPEWLMVDTTDRADGADGEAHRAVRLLTWKRVSVNGASEHFDNKTPRTRF